MEKEAVTTDPSPAQAGLQKARAIVGALLSDDDETYAGLVRDAAAMADPACSAIIGSLAGMLAGNVHMIAASRGEDPLEFWLAAVGRSMDKGV